MKKLSAALIMLFLIGCYSTQIAPLKERQRSETIQFAGMNKSKIYQKSLQWFATKFGSANDIIQYKNEKEGKIIGKIVTTGQDSLYTFYFHSTITIDTQNNKSILNLEASQMDVGNEKANITKDLAKLLQQSYDEVITSYKNFIK